MMNSGLLHPLASSDYSMSTAENECLPHHHQFANDHHQQLQRHAQQQQQQQQQQHQQQHHHQHPNGTRYMAHRPQQPHDGQFHATQTLSDSTTASISTSPSSNASSLVAHYPTSTVYQTGGLQQPATYPHLYPSNSYPTAYAQMAGLRQRGSSIPDHSSSSQMLPPSLGTTLRDNYTTSPPYLQRNPHSPRSHSYTHIPDIPRSVLPATMPLSPQPGSHYGASASALLAYPAAQHDRHETPPFDDQQNFYDIRTDNDTVVPKIEAKIEKGFFLSQDRVWTCYRRNYFSVQSSYSLNPHLPNERLYMSRGGGKPVEQIQALAMSLSAAVDGPTGKIIELIQHTPKRDKGPQLPIAKERLLPAPPGKTQSDAHGYPLTSFHSSQTIASPFLPLQNDTDSSSSSSMSSGGHAHNAYAHTFERIQFKSATANNGKRRAQQQYYHLIVELWADVRRTGETKPTWIKVAQRVSAAVVVRGRSPSHYSNEGPTTSGASRHGGHGGAGSGSGGAGHTSYGGSSVGYSRTINNNLAGMIGGGAYGGYRPGSTYSLNPSPVGSHSVSSASSISGGPVEGMVGDHHMEDVDSKPADGYQYYPNALYDSGLHGPRHPDHHTVTQHGLDESRKVKDEYTSGPGFATNWPLTGHCGKYSSVNTSQGYYPDLQVQHATTY